MKEAFNPGHANHELALSIGEDALTRIGAEGLHALAVEVRDDAEFELIVVPDHPATLEDLLRWEHHTGELNLSFHGRAHIEMRIMGHDEFHALTDAQEPQFNQVVADA